MGSRVLDLGQTSHVKQGFRFRAKVSGKQGFRFEAKVYDQLISRGFIDRVRLLIEGVRYSGRGKGLPIMLGTALGESSKVR